MTQDHYTQTDTHTHTWLRGKMNKLCLQQLCSAAIQFSGTLNYQRTEAYNRIFTVLLTQLHCASDVHVTVHHDKFNRMRSILILLASCQQTCVTYTTAVCTV
jgi:hypothetical protein